MSKAIPPKAPHMEALNGNINDVRRIMKITGRASSKKPDKRILRKGAIVLFTACWEAFIEDLARSAFVFLAKHAKTADKLPGAVKRHMTKKWTGKEKVDPLEFWILADAGWKKVLKEHGNGIIKQWIGSVNTPNSEVVDNTFECLIGLKNLSNQWQWKGIPARSAKKKLNQYIFLRGQIAHRVKADYLITSKLVFEYTDFIFRLAVRSNNAVQKHLHKLTQKVPWDSYSFGKTS